MSLGKHAPSVQETLQEAESEHLLDCPQSKPEIRAAATLLDLAFFLVLTGGIDAITHSFHRWISLSSTGSMLVRITAFLAIFVWPLVYFRHTPGKKMMGVRVVRNRDGHPPTFATALAREAIFKPLMVLSGIGVYWFFRQKNPFALHDRWAGTSAKRVHGVR